MDFHTVLINLQQLLTTYLLSIKIKVVLIDVRLVIVIKSSEVRMIPA